MLDTLQRIGGSNWHIVFGLGGLVAFVIVGVLALVLADLLFGRGTERARWAAAILLTLGLLPIAVLDIAIGVAGVFGLVNGTMTPLQWRMSAGVGTVGVLMVPLWWSVQRGMIWQAGK